MRRFRRVRGRRFSRRGVVRYGTVRSCPALRCPGTGASRCARDLPSGKPPFSVRPLRGEKGGPEGPRRSAADPGAVRDPALVGGPLVPRCRPGAALPADNRDFPDAKSRERRQPPVPRRAAVRARAFQSVGERLMDRTGMPAALVEPQIYQVPRRTPRWANPRS